MPKIKAGVSFGHWKLVEYIGSGHSSLVWKAVGPDDRVGAIKLLKKNYVTVRRQYERFKNEVRTMQACADIPGVLPLWDSAIPDNPVHDGDAWLVSPFGVPLLQWRGDESVDEAVRICTSLAATLSEMHARSYSHRDIKPANILYWDGGWHLGDFGIAAGPELSRQTQEGEKLGPTFYIAPEMLNNSTSSDGRPADVYSLAKLLWKLATGQNFPLPGVQQRDHPALNVSGYVKDRRAHTLDALLEAATQTEPHMRPTMKDIAKSLAGWFDPVPEQQGPLDLQPLKNVVAELLAPSQSEERRRQKVAKQANREISGFFWPFRSLAGDIWKALQGAGIYEIHTNDVEGGNIHFCREYATERDSFFEYSIIAVLRSERKRASIMGGVNLGLRNVGDGTTSNIYAPVLGAAGYLLELHVFDGTTWRESSTLLWGAKEEFLLGGPDCEAAQKRFSAGLIENLYPSVEALLKAYDEA